jgi:hypothetical protein
LSLARGMLRPGSQSASYSLGTPTPCTPGPEVAEATKARPQGFQKPWGLGPETLLADRGLGLHICRVKNALGNDAVDAPVAVYHLGDGKVGPYANQRKRLIFGEVHAIH